MALLNRHPWLRQRYLGAILTLACLSRAAPGLSLPPVTEAQAGGSSDLQRIVLEVGESTELALSAEEEVKVSRKGVIALQWLNPELARVIALKPGFVVITALPKDDYIAKTYALEVIAPPQSAKAPPPPALLPAWLCATGRSEKKGPQHGPCQPEGGLLRGVVDDGLQFLRARAFCAARPNLCRYEASLSPQGQTAVQQHLSALLGEAIEVDVRPTGSVLVLVPCDGLNAKATSLNAYRQFVDSLTNGLVKAKVLAVACRSTWQLRRFIVASKVILTNTASTQLHGFETELAYQLHTPHPPLLSASLQQLLREQKAKVIGEPWLRILAGRKGLAQSGGEFLVPRDALLVGPHAPKAELWKEYGVKLQALIDPLPGGGEVLVDFDLSLTQPSFGREHLEASHLQAQIVAPLNRELIAGSISLASSAERASSLPLLDKLPLVGPLLRGFNQQKAQLKIYLWLQVREEPKGPPPPPTGPLEG